MKPFSHSSKHDACISSVTSHQLHFCPAHKFSVRRICLLHIQTLCITSTSSFVCKVELQLCLLRASRESRKKITGKWGKIFSPRTKLSRLFLSFSRAESHEGSQFFLDIFLVRTWVFLIPWNKRTLWIGKFHIKVQLFDIESCCTLKFGLESWSWR